ncbi:unnamed protein product [Diabrotica balteata]|uniref:Uncharacterized protein n=1 Tax=Diabrotica balteata TaxID=107213 RepID=A0A9N9XFT0_DIABA|nr:unnamed protein product [Diabrotica balteata]
MSKKTNTITTRKCTEAHIVGQPLDISDINVLPTKSDVLSKLEKCLCPAPRKVPKLEHAFLTDQRNLRMMIIRGIDQAETKNVKKRNKRKEKSLQSKLSSNVELTTPPDLINVDILSSNSDDESMEEESSRPDEKVQGSKITTPRNKIESPSMKAVVKGKCPSELASRNPGNLSHARWLTLANRILRLYISTIEPTPHLRKLAEFVMKVYATSKFTIKCRSKIIHASQHFFFIEQCTKFLDSELKAVAQRNAFMANPEHILLGMLFASRKHVRALAGKGIIKALQTETRKHRAFRPPQVNFEAEDYIDLIDWQSTTVTEPLLIADCSKEEIKMIVNSGSSERKEFKIPLHTQAVERVVKKVTAASKHVCGVQGREGFKRSRLLNRNYLSKFETKRQYTSATAILQK